MTRYAQTDSLSEKFKNTEKRKNSKQRFRTIEWQFGKGKLLDESPSGIARYEAISEEYMGFCVA